MSPINPPTLLLLLLMILQLFAEEKNHIKKLKHENIHIHIKNEETKENIKKLDGDEDNVQKTTSIKPNLDLRNLSYFQNQNITQKDVSSFLNNPKTNISEKNSFPNNTNTINLKILSYDKIKNSSSNTTEAKKNVSDITDVNNKTTETKLKSNLKFNSKNLTLNSSGEKLRVPKYFNDTNKIIFTDRIIPDIQDTVQNVTSKTVDHDPKLSNNNTEFNNNHHNKTFKKSENLNKSPVKTKFNSHDVKNQNYVNQINIITANFNQNMSALQTERKTKENHTQNNLLYPSKIPDKIIKNIPEKQNINKKDTPTKNDLENSQENVSPQIKNQSIKNVNKTDEKNRLKEINKNIINERRASELNKAPNISLSSTLIDNIKNDKKLIDPQKNKNEHLTKLEKEKTLETLPELNKKQLINVTRNKVEIEEQNKTHIKNSSTVSNNIQINFTEIDIEKEERNSTFEFYKNETDYIKSDFTRIENLTEVLNETEIDEEITEKETNITQIIETVQINKTNNKKQTTTEKKETRTINKVEKKIENETKTNKQLETHQKNLVFAKIINKTNETHQQFNTTYGKILVKELNGTKINRSEIYGTVHIQGSHKPDQKIHAHNQTIFGTILKNQNVTSIHSNVTYGKIIKETDKNITVSVKPLYGTILERKNISDKQKNTKNITFGVVKSNTTPKNKTYSIIKSENTNETQNKNATFGKVICQKVEKTKKYKLEIYGTIKNVTNEKNKIKTGNENKITDNNKELTKGKHEIILMFSTRHENNTTKPEETKNNTQIQSNETIDLKINKTITHLKNISILRPKPNITFESKKKYLPKPKIDRCTCFWPIEIQKTKIPKTKNKGIFRVLNLHIHHQIEEETFEKKHPPFGGRKLVPIPENKELKFPIEIQNDQIHGKIPSINLERNNRLEINHISKRPPMIQLDKIYQNHEKAPIINLDINDLNSKHINNTYLVPLATEIKSKRSKTYTNSTIFHKIHSKKTEDQFPENIERRNASYRRKLDSSSRLIENLPNIRFPSERSKDKRTVVSLLGLFELSTKDGERPEGRSELAAAHLAVKHINSKKLLPGYTLELLYNDTKVSE